MFSVGLFYDFPALDAIEEKIQPKLPKKVDIAQPYIPDSLLPRSLEAFFGGRFGDKRQVGHVKMGVKGQKAVGDFGIDKSDETREGSHLFLLHVAGNYEGGGDNQGGTGLQ
jgi:hypothetical protein